MTIRAAFRGDHFPPASVPFSSRVSRMMIYVRCRLLTCIGILGVFVGGALWPGRWSSLPAAEGRTAAVDFSREILPILSENCFACHGPDAKQRKAKLRLDSKDGALAKLRSGDHAIVPGKASHSKLI